MPKGKEYTNFTILDKDKILEITDEISESMSGYIRKNNSSEFVLLYKYINHSDLITAGKATKINSLKKNYLYYLTEDQMWQIQQETEKNFQTAHQSCISLSEDFYKFSKLPNPRDVETYRIDDFANVYVVNDTLEYFNSEYTSKIFEKLDKTKNVKWDFSKFEFKKDNSTWITSLSVSVAVHGLGTSDDKEFHKLRHHIFKSDAFVIIYEKKTGRPNVYILLNKNPAFYSILGLANKNYVRYMERIRKRVIAKAKLKQNAMQPGEEDDVVKRQKQSKWRKMLAEEMFGFTQVDGQVMCPFTWITADFNKVGALFVASHIKGFSDPNTTDEEKYDINNGLLLCANADALFDKHLISIDKDKNLVFSFLLDDDIILKQKLLLLQPIFTQVLNEKRMEYLKYHKALFDKLEKERKFD